MSPAVYEVVCSCGRRDRIPDGTDAFNEHMREHYRNDEYTAMRWVEIDGQATDRIRKERVR